MVISEIFNSLNYFFKLTFSPEVLWNIIPLAIATLFVMIYYQINTKEHADWGSYLSNTLILLFVSMNLFRYIYNIDGLGGYNFVEYFIKTAATAILLLLGLLLLRFNFEHVLPEKIARHISSPLIVNSFVYVVILFVYSTKLISWSRIISLILLLLIVILFLNLIKIPFRFFKDYLEKEKKKDRIMNLKEAVFQLKELKIKLRDQAKELKTVRLREAENKKKEGLKFKKIIGKVIPKKRKKK